MSAPTFLAHGAYADVFDLRDGTVAKVFRRTAHTHGPVVDWDDHDFLTRQLFEVECAAYQRLQASPGILPHIPAYFGKIASATLAQCLSTGEPFVAGCALRLERITGKDTELAFIPSRTQRAIELVLEEIREAYPQIDVWDCSCFVPGPKSEFVIVDFAYWRHLPDLQLYLDTNKQIPTELRERLKNAV